MQKYATYFLFFLQLCYTSSALGQQSRTKSKEVLLTELNSMKDDSNKVNAFVKSERIIGYDHHEFLETYLKVRDLAKKLNYQSGLMNINFAIGNYYLTKTEFAKALEIGQLNLDLAKKNKSKVKQVYANNFIGLIYFITQDVEQSLTHFKQSLQLSQEMKNGYMVCEAYQAISMVYGSANQYVAALANAKKALATADQLKDKKIYGEVYCSLATDYYLNKQYLESFNYCQKAINDQWLNESSIGVAKGVLGKVYKDAPDSLLQKIGVKPSQRQQEALKYFNQSLAISLKYNNTFSITSNYLEVSKSSAQLKQYKTAYEAYQNHILYRDSTTNASESRKVAQSDARFQYLKKEESLKYQQKLSQVKANQQRNYFIVGIAILLLVSFFVSRNYFIQKKLNKLISVEKQRSDDLLNNILPADVAEELKKTGQAHARTFDEVTVIFTDFVNFTHVGELLSAQELVDELNHCFKTFDGIITQYGIEKIKTIGDAYLAVSGLPNTDPDHAVKAIKAALAIQEFISNRKLALGAKTFDIRIGIHSGSVVAGIVGVKKFAYDIWGDTVNTAARMEQNSEPGKINISEKTKELLKDEFSLTYRGEIEAKNKGALKMYFVNN